MYYLFELGGENYKSISIFTKIPTRRVFRVEKVLWKSELSLMMEGLKICIRKGNKCIFKSEDQNKVIERGMLEIL